MSRNTRSSCSNSTYISKMTAEPPIGWTQQCPPSKQIICHLSSYEKHFLCMVPSSAPVSQPGVLPVYLLSVERTIKSTGLTTPRLKEVVALFSSQRECTASLFCPPLWLDVFCLVKEMEKWGQALRLDSLAWLQVVWEGIRCKVRKCVQISSHITVCPSHTADSTVNECQI